MNVQSRAKRILTPLSSYQPIEEVGSLLFPLRDFAVLRGATPLGVYSNTPGESQEALLVSDIGVFLNCGEEVRFVEYKTINKVDIAADGRIVGADATALKIDADGLLVTAEHSAPVFLPVRNGHGKYRDVFEFSRFMNRAAEDSRSEVKGVHRPQT